MRRVGSLLKLDIYSEALDRNAIVSFYLLSTSSGLVMVLTA